MEIDRESRTLASERAGVTFVVDELAAATVEVRDTGMDDRLAAYVTAECRRL